LVSPVFPFLSVSSYSPKFEFVMVSAVTGRSLLEFFLRAALAEKNIFPGEPNQALEPTHIAVTDRACARSAPAICVAHL
jgi:hypothetical protein